MTTIFSRLQPFQPYGWRRPWPQAKTPPHPRRQTLPALRPTLRSRQQFGQSLQSFLGYEAPSRVAQPDPVDQILKPYLEDGLQAPVIVTRIDGDTTRTYSYEDADATQPGLQNLDSETVFPIASVTKAFTGVLLADMVGRGEVQSEDPVNLHLPPEVQLPSYQGAEITLEQLATHTSGLPGQAVVPGDPDFPGSQQQLGDPENDNEELFTFLSHYELTRAPGEAYEYSNIGIAILGEALAYRSSENAGEPYDPATSYSRLLEERVLEPLDLQDPTFQLNPDQQARLAPNLLSSGAQAPEIAPLDPSGGLYSTAADLARFTQANLQAAQKSDLGVELSPIEQALHDAQQAYDTTVGPDGSEVGLGLGWTVFDGDEVKKDGGRPGLHSVVTFSQDQGVGFVILAGSSEVPAGRIGSELLTQGVPNKPDQTG